MAYPEQNQKDEPPKRFPKRTSVAGDPGRCGLLRNGLAWRDCDRQSAIAVSAPWVRGRCANAGLFRKRWFQRLQESGRERGMHTATGSEISRSKCGPGGWPGPHFFYRVGCRLPPSRQAECPAFHLRLLIFAKYSPMLKSYGAAVSTCPADGSFAIQSRAFARRYPSELLYYKIRNQMKAIMSPQKIRFRKTFPKDLPTIHKRYARTIALALDEISSRPAPS